MATSTRRGRKPGKDYPVAFTTMDEQQLKDAVSWRITQLGLVSFAASDEVNRARYAVEAKAALDLLVDRLIQPPFAF